MKTILTFLLLSLTLAGELAAAAPASTPVYQCPMHPWIKSDKPGDKCTICGMALVAASAGGNLTEADPNLVTLTPGAARVVGVQTAAVRRAPLVRTLRVTGVIEDDDTRHRILTTRVPGRVERLFVNYLGAEVRAGEPLATLFSPAVLSAERVYVERLKAGASAFTAADRAAAREQLQALDLNEDDITGLERTLEPNASVVLRAPVSGTVVARHVYEGQQLNKDQAETETRLFEIADLSSMWFVFDAYEPDLAWLRPGLPIEISTASLPDRPLTARIAFIDPTLNEMTRTARVRVTLTNHDKILFHRQTATGRVRLELPDVLLAPRSAVLQHGARPMVFVQQRDRSYLARPVQLGRVGDNTVEILAGLQEGDRVVTEGGLILDGQAQLSRAVISNDDQLKTLAFAAADAASALASDDFAAYQQQLPALRAGLQAYLDSGASPAASPLAEYRDELRDRSDLTAARRDFEPFSTTLADEARTRRLTQREGLHVFQCPMSPVLGKGRWLSRTDQLRNPFFGAVMLTCGEEIK